MKIKFLPETVAIFFFVDFAIAFVELRRELASLRADAENPCNGDGDVDQKPFYSDTLAEKLCCPVCNRPARIFVGEEEEEENPPALMANHIILICRYNHATTFKWEPHKGWIWVSTEADVTVEKAQSNCGPA